MADPADFSKLKRLLAQAEVDQREAALTELIACFGQHIRRFARHLLHRRLRQLLDSEEVLQSVCLRLLTEVRKRPVASGQEGALQLETEEEFLKWQKAITQNLVFDKHAYINAAKRDARRQVSLDNRDPAAGPEDRRRDVSNQDDRRPGAAVEGARYRVLTGKVSLVT